MNSYKRVTTALESKEPDRVPIVEFIIDPKLIREICPRAKNQADFEELMELDGVCCGAQFNKISANSNGTYIDEWNVLYGPGPEVVNRPIDDLKDYALPDPHASWRLGKLPELVRCFMNRGVK